MTSGVTTALGGHPGFLDRNGRRRTSTDATVSSPPRRKLTLLRRFGRLLPIAKSTGGHEAWAGRVGEEGAETDAPATTDGSLFDALKSVFAGYQWPFSEVENMPVLLSELSGPRGNWTFCAQVVEAQELVLFFSVCPVTVPEERRREMAAFLTHANYGLGMGNFELDFADGEIRYKTALCVEGGNLRPELVKRFVRANGIGMETFLPGIGAVAAGMPAAEALEASHS